MRRRDSGGWEEMLMVIDGGGVGTGLGMISRVVESGFTLCLSFILEPYRNMFGLPVENNIDASVRHSFGHTTEKSE